MSPIKYRKDIDGLRAIAVIVVVFFHFGYLPNGYLGVDIFFVISGFLITKILYLNTIQGTLSIRKFYIKRIRRIIPLTLFISTVAILLGCMVMLPSDLDSLCQSFIATNLFCNNILEVLTATNYWDVSSEYKPLLHSWSLAIEEQYYLLYPFLFVLLRKKFQTIGYVLIFFSIISIGLFLNVEDKDYQFYLLPYRFFELAVGGIVAIYFSGKAINSPFSVLFLIALVLFLMLPNPIFIHEANVIITILLTALLLISNNGSTINRLLISNRLMVFIGKISFSLYMWHQLVLAFTRYFMLPEIEGINVVTISGVIFFLAVATYYLIEQPFRSFTFISNKQIAFVLSLVFIGTMSLAMKIYFEGGVIRNVPELGIDKKSAYRNMHLDYNTQHVHSTNAFKVEDKIKVLVIGNSFARDWINVLLESKYKNKLVISYHTQIDNSPSFIDRLKKADKIFFNYPQSKQVNTLLNKYNIDRSRVWIIGIKNFGVSNGIFYNDTHEENKYCHQRTYMLNHVYFINDRLWEEWDNRYIDLVYLLADQNGKVPVFTPNCKFISQDCKHLTISGARYIADLLTKDPIYNLHEILLSK